MSNPKRVLLIAATCHAANLALQLAAGDIEVQIGRASCRERVYPTV